MTRARGEPAGLAPDAKAYCDGETIVRADSAARGSADLRDAILTCLGLPSPIRLPDLSPRIRTPMAHKPKPSLPRRVEPPRCSENSALIRARVAEHFGLDVESLVAPPKTREVTRPRQIGMYLMKRLTSASYPRTAHAFGRGDHTTAIHAVQVIEKVRSQRGELAASVDYLEAELAEALMRAEHLR